MKIPEDKSERLLATVYIALFVGAATVGVAYTISMSNWNNYVFAYWGDGSTNPGRTVTPTTSATLTAYYSTGGLF
ncbi:MAG: hypothetical protein JRN06_09660 [Nitrososphaerota archaeon]|nr:hypothetical protein [Nitrososphaerota archaeon]MDG7024851.1 hypothetical protein [Nitrososphaerota archaeon]